MGLEETKRPAIVAPGNRHALPSRFVRSRWSLTHPSRRIGSRLTVGSRFPAVTAHTTEALTSFRPRSSPRPSARHYTPDGRSGIRRGSPLLSKQAVVSFEFSAFLEIEPSTSLQAETDTESGRRPERWRSSGRVSSAYRPTTWLC